MKNQAGTSLVELVIYTAIIGTIMFVMASFLLNLLQVRTKTLAISEVVAAGQAIQHRLEQATTHAESIDVGSSTFDLDPGVLSLNMVDASVDPTVFSLTSDDGEFQISEAGGTNQTLTSARTEVTNFVVTNLTSSSDVGIIQVQFTVGAVNNGTDKLFSYEEDFQTTLRIPLDQ